MNEPLVPTVAESDIRDAFRVLAKSATFSGSDRLIGFLGYVVTETLEGRGELIRAKSIALDVYDYEPGEVEKREGVVRVDGGRVRRKLKEYYGSEGKDARVRIDLPKGGYVPVFSTAPKPLGPKSKSSHRKRPFWRLSFVTAAGIVAVLIGVLAWFGHDVSSHKNTAQAQAETESLRRAVLFDTSPARLQAVNLAEQGRALIFPATDPERLRAAQHVFEAVMNLDATYAGGYAGAAQVFGLRALLSPNPQTSAVLADQSQDLAIQALKLSPEQPWSLSARAWAYFARGEYEAAVDWSQKAKDLAPDDPNILEFDALILLYNGMFQEVLNDTAQLAETSSYPLPFVFQNARSAAYFHLGEYEKAIAGFENAISQGAPLGPVTVSYMMAAHHWLGDTKRAHDLATKYSTTWPDQRVDLMKKRLFKDVNYSAGLIDGMLAAGWQPN